ncbi:hypothetical protein FAGKG844_480032 [Frankia sp. AgKG'84/4]
MEGDRSSTRETRIGQRDCQGGSADGPLGAARAGAAATDTVARTASNPMMIAAVALLRGR